MPGAAGDVVAATIDSRLYTWDGRSDSHLVVDDARSFLRRDWLTQGLSNTEINELLKSYEYDSITSHKLEYHIQEQHDYILIDSGDLEYAEWAANRFSNILTMYDKDPRNIKSINHINFCTIASKHTSRIIKLQDIIEGKMIHCLENLTDKPLDPSFYDKWLNRNKL